jgi:hypothetical protein
VIYAKRGSVGIAEVNGAAIGIVDVEKVISGVGRGVKIEIVRDDIITEV